MTSYGKSLSGMLKRGALASVIAAFVGFSPGASAATQTFTTPTGSTLDGLPVGASATFTTSTNQILLTLTNLISNPTSVIQAISDIFFVATDPTNGVLTGGTGLKSPTTASYINIGTGGSVTAGDCCAVWGLENNGGTYHLNGLTGKGAGGTGPAYLIIGPGPYTNANGSIAGNTAHNPFTDTSATFTLAIQGVTTDTVISDVVFSFGTEAGRNVGIPIPAAVWLFGSGLLGLIAVARRRYSGAAAMPAAA